MQFYDLTPQEIYDLIATQNARTAERSRSSAMFAWHTAYLIGLAVNNPKKFPQTAADHFPWLDERPAWVRSKEKMAQFAQRHNAQHGGGV